MNDIVEYTVRECERILAQTLLDVKLEENLKEVREVIKVLDEKIEVFQKEGKQDAVDSFSTIKNHFHLLEYLILEKD